MRENGLQAVEEFESSVPGTYDAILMDIQMPVMNGYEATKAIRRSSHELAKTIPIIAMTAKCILRGYSAFSGSRYEMRMFQNPVEMKILEKTIRSIRSGGGTEPQVIEQ